MPKQFSLLRFKLLIDILKTFVGIKQKKIPKPNIKSWASIVATASQVTVTFSKGPNANKVERPTLIKITPKFKITSLKVLPLDFSIAIKVLFIVVIIKIIIWTL